MTGIVQYSAILLVALGMLFACSGPSPSNPSTQSSNAPLPENVAESSSETPSSTDATNGAQKNELSHRGDASSTSCEDLRESASSIVTGSPYPCTGDDDCQMYPIFINCGGAADRPHAERIGELYKQFRSQGCRLTIRCKARLNREAVCKGGRCVAVSKTP